MFTYKKVGGLGRAVSRLLTSQALYKWSPPLLNLLSQMHWGTFVSQLNTEIEGRQMGVNSCNIS